MIFVVEKNENVGGFEGGAPGIIEKLGKFGFVETPRSFGDIVGDAQCRCTKLFGPSKLFTLLQCIGDLEKRPANKRRTLPDVELLKTKLVGFHVMPFFLTPRSILPAPCSQPCLAGGEAGFEVFVGGGEALLEGHDWLPTAGADG